MKTNRRDSIRIAGVTGAGMITTGLTTRRTENKNPILLHTLRKLQNRNTNNF